VEQLKAQLDSSRTASETQYQNHLRINKYPAMEAYQQGNITATQYEEVVGEPYIDTVRDVYAADLATLKATMATRVKRGLITPEEYKEITGDDYPESGAAKQ